MNSVTGNHDIYERGAIKPTPLDVLLGRGKSYRGNPGNVRFHELIQLNHEKYNDSSNRKKRLVIADIVSSIHETGRFVQKDNDGCWFMVSMETIRQKVAHSLQYHIRKHIEQGHQDSSSSSPTRIMSQQEKYEIIQPNVQDVGTRYMVAEGCNVERQGLVEMPGELGSSDQRAYPEVSQEIGRTQFAESQERLLMSLTTNAATFPSKFATPMSREWIRYDEISPYDATPSMPGCIMRTENGKVNEPLKRTSRD